MHILEEEFSASQYNAKKDVILPYIAGCTWIFFTNWVNNPIDFDTKKNILFSGNFIDYILLFSSEKNSCAEQQK